MAKRPHFSLNWEVHHHAEDVPKQGSLFPTQPAVDETYAAFKERDPTYAAFEEQQKLEGQQRQAQLEEEAKERE